MKDAFRGDTPHLVSSIEALLSLDADGALVPHGIGGHARDLLSAAAARLTSPMTNAHEDPAFQGNRGRAGINHTGQHCSPSENFRPQLSSRECLAQLKALV